MRTEAVLYGERRCRRIEATSKTFASTRRRQYGTQTNSSYIQKVATMGKAGINYRRDPGHVQYQGGARSLCLGMGKGGVQQCGGEALASVATDRQGTFHWMPVNISVISNPH